MFSQDESRPFERVMGCTSKELISWLTAALPTAALTIDVPRQNCQAAFVDGELLIEWAELDPLRIALVRLPRLSVRFTYSGLSTERRRQVQIGFDRATQRGGG